ncbi:type I polyketide synthase [Streptomyces sp. NPDC047072]|uniref:type I polyketide synthase n=1 Tax=Streptomyces sp. NPDC047072 TaxID=3154809 RepID=UPI0033F613B4
MNEHDQQSIAVIGLGCRFPGAESPARFWSNLVAGVESVQVEGSTPDGWLRARSVLEGIEEFDAGFFGYSPREAALLDPQHRLFLEVCWEALEDGGAAGRRRTSGIGVYGGSGTSLYLMHHLSGQTGKALPNYLDSSEDLRLAMAAERDYLTSRVSYKLDLDGPSVNVQAACATSLYALHLACQALLAGECDLALAGGAHVPVPQIDGYRPEPGLVMSQDGHCRSFDAGATGTVFGSGVGAVLLKPLVRALADGDRVYAVVRGTAVNNDGAGKPGFSAPSVSGQAAVVRQALAAADVDPATVGYVEAHGTATPTGDPIEVEALTEAFEGVAPRSCALGSVKTNIGHLSWAGGIAGVIKTALALWHRRIPASLHFRTPNPAIDFAGSPFYVQTETADWPRGVSPRRAGVSAFGLGGTNAHVVLEEAPASAPVPERPEGPQVLALSGRSEPALRELASRVGAALLAEEAPEPVDAAYSLGTGRRHFAHRAAVVAPDRKTLATLLGAVADGHEDAADRFEGEIGLATGKAPSARPRLTMLFSGQGGEYLEAGRDLYRHEPVFREFLDAAGPEFERYTGHGLTEFLYQDPARRGMPLTDIRLAQPVVYTLQVALARLWEHWGLTADTLVGHSLGEYAAAHHAGVFDFGTGLYLVSERARLLGTLPESGAMAAVFTGADEVRELLAGQDEIGIAALNAPGRTVISGDGRALERVLAEAERRGLGCRRLRIGRAAHSAQLDPVLDDYTAVLESVELRPPTRTLVSTLTGVEEGARLATAMYWRRQLREPVRFHDAVRAAATGSDVFLEIGLSNTLTGLVPLVLDDGGLSEPACLETLRWERDDLASTRLALAGAYTAGLDVDWAAVSPGGRTVSLPTYPFQRRRHWVAPAVAGTADRVDSDTMGALDAVPQREGTGHSVVVWTDAEPDTPRAVERCLLLAPTAASATELTGELSRLGVGVRVHVLGEGEGAGEGPGEAEGVGANPDPDPAVSSLAQALLDHRPDLLLNAVPALSSRRTALAGLPHTTGSVADDVAAAGGIATLRAVQAASAANLPGLTLCTVTSGAHRVLDSDDVLPEQGAVTGIARTARTEFPTMRHLLVDLGAADTRQRWPRAAARLAATAAAPPATDAELALRGERLLLPRLRPAAPPEAGPRVRVGPEGWYVVTGGLFGVGLECAHALLELGARRLVLCGRRAPDEESTERLDRLRRRYGAQIRTEHLDVTRQDQVERLFTTYSAEDSVIRGVVHAAGLVDDAILDRTDWDRMTRVLGPKAQGAWNLHRSAAAHAPDLDLFVLTSSYGGLFGNPGQAGHAAACTFLDALAGHRRALGLAGLSLDLGSWSDVGILAGNEEFLSGLERQGIGTISADEGRTAVRTAIEGWPSGQVAVLPTRWDRLDPEHHLASNPVLAGVRTGGGPRDETDPAGPAGPDDVLAVCRQVVSRVLGYGDEELAGLDLTEAGMDSLNALTIRNRLQRLLAVPLPASICFDRPSLAELAADVEKRMTEAGHRD